MREHPTNFNKENFLKYLRENRVSNEIIDKFVKLPENICRNDNEFKLNIVVTFFSIDKTYYNFEMNYYSEELVEYLFNVKIFNNIEVSVNYLICELFTKNYINKLF